VPGLMRGGSAAVMKVNWKGAMLACNNGAEE